jgi:hypothetical protein
VSVAQGEQSRREGGDERGVPARRPHQAQARRQILQLMGLEEAGQSSFHQCCGSGAFLAPRSGMSKTPGP